MEDMMTTDVTEKVAHVIDGLIADSSFDRSLRYALITTLSPDGNVIIGDCVISNNIGDDNRHNGYTVRRNGLFLFDVCLLDIATFICGLLSDGYDLSDSQITELIRLDAEYSRAFFDAIFVKEQLKRRYDDRYQASLDYALQKMERVRLQIDNCVNS